MLLGKLIEYFESYDPANSPAVSEAYIYAAGISLSTISLTVLHHLYFYHVQRAGMKIRVAVCHMIYRKASHYDMPANKCHPLNSAVVNWTYTFVPQRLCVLTAQHWPKQLQDRLWTSYPMMSTSLTRWMKISALSFQFKCYLPESYIAKFCLELFYTYIDWFILIILKSLLCGAAELYCNILTGVSIILSIVFIWVLVLNEKHEVIALRRFFCRDLLSCIFELMFFFWLAL